MAQQPGIILYFEIADALRGLSDEDNGKLLIAMLDYGQYGAVPEFSAPLNVIWGFLRPKLDADAKRYRLRIGKNLYAAYCAKVKRMGGTPLELEKWAQREGYDANWVRTVPCGAAGHPNTNASPETNINTISISDTDPYAEPDTDPFAEELTYEQRRDLWRRQVMNLPE